MRSPYEPTKVEDDTPEFSFTYQKWMDDAKCAEVVPDTKPPKPVYNPDLWFPPRDKSLYKPIADRAKSICFGRDGRDECPVRMQCLLQADAENEVHGIRGGMSHRERAALKRKAIKQGKTLEELARKASRQP